MENWRAVSTELISMASFSAASTPFVPCGRKGRDQSSTSRHASGQVGIPAAAAYASSKAAVRNHTKTVALYCAEQGLQIRFKCHPAGRSADTDVGADAR